MTNSQQQSQPIRINRVSIKGGEVYTSILQHSKTRSGLYKSQKSPSLTRVFKERGRLGLDAEILKMTAQGKIKLIGSHKSIRAYKEVLSDPDNLKEYSEAEVDALITTKRAEDLPTGKTYVIKMNGTTLAGVLTFKTHHGYELTPYSVDDLPDEKPKYFVLRNQAVQYLEYIKRNCPAYSRINFEIQEKKDVEDYRGIAKIATYCKKEDIPIELRKTTTIKGQGEDTTIIRVYRFKKNRDLRLEAHINEHKPSTYELWRRDENIYTTSNQLYMVEKLKNYKLK